MAELPGGQQANAPKELGHTHSNISEPERKPSPQVKIILLFESPEGFTYDPSQMFRIITEGFDPKHKPTREGTKTDQEETTTPYKKMNDGVTHTDEMFGQRQMSHGHLFLFKYRFVGW